jgi:acyl-CoA dehydrogenase
MRKSRLFANKSGATLLPRSRRISRAGAAKALFRAKYGAPSGISLVVLETENSPGFRIGRRLEKLGQHASDTTELFFDGVYILEDQLLGETEGQGFRQLMSQLPYERLLLTVPAAAVIERAVEVTVEYCEQRKAFGQTISEFQNTRFKLAECATLAHVVRTFVNDCIQRLLDGTLDDEAAYMAKWWCSEQQCKSPMNACSYSAATAT